MCSNIAERLSVSPQGVYGAGAHTDYGMLTVLVTDGTPGLQIHADGKWNPVQPIPGTFIINLGDMLERYARHAHRASRQSISSFACSLLLRRSLMSPADAQTCVDRKPRWPHVCCNTTSQTILSQIAVAYCDLCTCQVDQWHFPLNPAQGRQQCWQGAVQHSVLL